MKERAKYSFLSFLQGVILFHTFFYSPNLYGLSGLTSVIVRSTLFTFSDSDNTVEGFVALRAGFSIDSAISTPAYLSALMPISGPITLNGKTLQLKENCTLDAGATLSGSGTLSTDGTARTLYLNEDITYNGTLTINNDLTIDGNNHVLDFDSTGAFTIASGVTLTLYNVRLRNIKNGTFSMSDTTSTLYCCNVSLYLNGSCTISQGALIFDGEHNKIDGVSGSSLSFSSSQNCTIKPYSKLSIMRGITLIHNSSNAGALAQNLVFESATSCMLLEGGSLKAAHADGLALKTGTLWVDHGAYIEGYIAFDNSGTSSDFTVVLKPGCKIAQQPDATIVLSDTAL